MNGGVLRQNGDAALALEIGVVERPLRYALVGAKRPALVQQRVDQRGFAVVDMRDDGDVTYEGIGNRHPIKYTGPPRLPRLTAPVGELVARLRGGRLP